MEELMKNIMVCVTQQKSCEGLIEQGYKLKEVKDRLFVIHVEKYDWKYFSQLKESDALEYLFDVSKQYNAELTVIKADDIEKTLNEFAEKNDIDVVVMGESLEPSAQQNMIKRLQRETYKNMDFIVVPK